MPFQNRDEAAHRLAQSLAQYHGKNPLILAIPRGAVPMAKVIADTLGGELWPVMAMWARAAPRPCAP